MAQVQCPNCGGYDTYLREPGVPLTDNLSGPGCGIGFIGGLVTASILLAAFRAVNPELEISAVMILWPIMGFLIWIGVAALMRKPRNDYLYYCRLCKYEWDERTIDRSKPIKANQTLITAGQQRLEEERRRRMWD